MAWRREIYVQAFEAAIRLQTSVVQLADLNVPDSEFAKMSHDDPAKIAKVSVIAGKDTICAVNAFLLKFSSCFLDLSLDRFVLAETRKQHAEETLSKADREMHLDLMRRCMEAGLSLSELAADALLFVRKEVEFPIDENEYRELAAKHLDGVRAAGTAYTAKIQKIIDEHC